MDYSSSRLHSGPLSEAAQRILVVLRAKSLRPASYNCSYFSSQRQIEGCNGSQREPLPQTSESMSQENRNDRNTNKPQVSASDHNPTIQSQSLQALTYYQQTPGNSLSPQSSSCWNSSLQRHMSPTEGYYQNSQMDSHRKYSVSPAPKCSPAMSLPQYEVSKTTASSMTDRHPQVTLRTNSTEEIRPCFILSPDVETLNELLFPTSEPLNTDKKKPAFGLWPEVTKTNLSTADALNRDKTTACWIVPRNKVEYTVASDSQMKWMHPLSAHTEETIIGAVDGRIVSQQSKSEAVKTGCLHVRRQDSSCDTGSSEPLRNADGKKGQDLTVDSENLTVSVGQTSDSKQEMELRMNKDVEEEDNRCLPIEKKSTSEMEWVLSLETNEDTNLEGSLYLITTSTRVKNACIDSGAKTEINKVKHGNSSEWEFKEVELGSENTMTTAACHCEGSLKISISGVGGDHGISPCQSENPVFAQTSETHTKGETLTQCEAAKRVLGFTTPRNLKGTEERTEMMENKKVKLGTGTEAGSDTGPKDRIKKEEPHCSDVQLLDRQSETKYKEVSVFSGLTVKDGEESLSPVEEEGNCKSRRSVFKEPCLDGNHKYPETSNGYIGGTSSSVVLTPASTFAFGKNSSLEDLTSTAVKPREKLRNNCLSSFQTPSPNPPVVPSISLKRKHKLLQDQSVNFTPKIGLIRHPQARRGSWEPPCSSQGVTAERQVSNWKTARPQTFIPKQQASQQNPLSKFNYLCETEVVGGQCIEPNMLGETKHKQSRIEETGYGFGINTSQQSPSSVACKLLKLNQTKWRPGQATNVPHISSERVNTCEPQHQSIGNLLSDPRIKHSGKLNPNEMTQLLDEARQTKALVLTMVYQDGTTQLHPEQKLSPQVCGVLVLMKNNLDCSEPGDLKPNDSLVYLKLDQTLAWAQQHEHEREQLFTREMLLQVLAGSQLVICYKANDFLCTALKFYKKDLTWKQVAACHIQDPQVSGWLLDPTDPSSCYHSLLIKHCKKLLKPPGLAAKKIAQVISDLSLLYWLNMELCSKLQNQGLWELYSDMELNMIPVLAEMESHSIHVDKEALRRMSDLLGTKIKQLEQEAHQAAGQMFLVTSNSQLRTVLFEKLRLHERCENRKLPKTINRLQQSTSEAALLQLQDFHPLPKVILEYRQVHKIKSTFVDGILSCMMSKNYISSMWCQTSVVTGRISAKHPNFQALPRQPLQITKKQWIQGKEEEVVTVHPRAMFIPQEGWTFVAADFCQVELRLLAHLSSDPELLHIFTTPQADIFTMLASQWKDKNESEVTSEDRDHAKRVVYSIVYGAGRKRLSGILGVSSEQASQFQDSFLQTYREVSAFIQRTIHQCQKQGYVLSLMGRRRTLPNINSTDWGIRMQAERQAVNFVVQGSAADLCKTAMIRIFNLVSSSSSLSARLIAQLHDELLYEVEDSQVEQFAALVKSTMESLQHIDHLGVHLKVPLKVAVSSGKSWGSMSELNIPSPSPYPPL